MRVWYTEGNMKKSLLIFAVIVVAIAVYVVVRPRPANGPAASPTPGVSASVMPSASPNAMPKSPVQTQDERTPAVHQVSIQDFKFSPGALTVVKGDTVVFTNRDGVIHTATSLTGPGSFDSGSISTNGTWTLDTAGLAAGTYDYKCTPHPFMRGSITIQ